MERPDKIPIGDRGRFGTWFANRVWGWRVVAPPQTRPIAIPKRGGAWNPKKQLNPKLKFFYCVREGFKPTAKKEQTVNDHSSNDQSSNDQTTVDQAIPDGKMIERRKRASCRCGCNAQLRIKRIAGNKYIVYKFVEKHNHCLVHEDDIKYLRTCRKLTYPKQLLLHQLSNVNLGPVRSFKVMKEMYGGFENIGATSFECKNFRRVLNHLIGNRDAHMVVQKLLARAEFCHGVSIEYLQDKNDKSLVGLFWADETAKRNYAVFGDVVSFDATFRSNRYNMVLVPFTGIDNHNRWNPAYFRNEPMSGLMRTTSRYESKNHFFGRITNTRLSLVEFVSHYDTAIDSPRFIYGKNDHDSMYTMLDLKTDLLVEREAAELYTRTLFYDVQEDIYPSLMNCYALNVHEGESHHHFVIRDT
ncbi:FAR1 DNA binding domain, zinc finger, SWIM-type, MULE transposase domain containing protein [Tanacetum coccineum]